ncbi:MAG: type I glyceraldehyde-3-phosphate dehydrogenase [Pseudomonadota bacterium]
MTTRIGINGFGRIGRQVLKAALERHPESLQVVAINDLSDVSTNAHLLKFDTNYKRWPHLVEIKGNELLVDGRVVVSFAQRDPRQIPWHDVGVDIVIEATGLFHTGPKASAHLDAGAKKVIITAPAKEEDITIVMGVNHLAYDPTRHHIVSNASCTTNCLAPPVKVIHDRFRITRGDMVTVHSYTNDQRILDVAHKDLRRARTAAQNIIPTTTGAARALSLVIPEMRGKIDGYSLRVPTPTVSIVDLAAVLEREVSTQELLDSLRQAAETYLKGIMGVEDEPLVSSDFVGDPRSSIVDMQFTQSVGGNMVRLVSWYDNEWGYSCRVVDLADYMSQAGR